MRNDHALILHGLRKILYVPKPPIPGSLDPASRRRGLHSIWGGRDAPCASVNLFFVKYAGKGILLCKPVSHISRLLSCMQDLLSGLKQTKTGVPVQLYTRLLQHALKSSSSVNRLSSCNL